MSRPYDLVLFGATGFTGRLVSAYLTRRYPSLSWAVAGRSPEKLATLREALVAIDPTATRIGTVEADTTSPDSLRAMAASTRVVLTTAGPFGRLGPPVVEACIAEGTDYVDITGEPAYVARLCVEHHERAAERGVRLIPCAGFDSVPHDLGAWLAVQQLPEDAEITLEGFVRAKGRPSGGTWSTALGAIGAGGSARLPGDRGTARGIRSSVHWEPRLSAWAVPLPTIDPQIVLRSARTLGYGSTFRYGHYAQVEKTSTLLWAGIGLGTVAAVARTPARSLLERAIPTGTGPDAQTRANSWFNVTFLAESSAGTARVAVHGGDPGYGETSKMAAETALCLAHDRQQLTEHLGCVTPASAMGARLVERLRSAGLGFDVLESPDT